MTLTELRYIIALAREKHFSKAAKRCFVSQPTLSVAINKLEDELSVRLFERNKNDIRVTEIGKKVIEQAQRTLDEAEKIKALAQSAKSQLNAPLRIGAIFTVAPYLFPHIVPKLRKLAPDMQLILQEDYTANLTEKLRNAELDAIFISSPFNESGIVKKELYTEPFVVLLPKNHPLSKRKRIRPDELKNEKVILKRLFSIVLHPRLISDKKYTNTCTVVRLFN